MRTETLKRQNDENLREAEAFVRKALSHISPKPLSERAVKAVTLKVAKAIPPAISDD